MILSALGVSVIDIVDDYMIAPSAEREYFLISLMKNLRLASPDEAALAKAFASSLLSRFRYAERCPVLFLRLIQQHISFYLHVEIVS